VRAIVLGPLAENYFRQAMIISHGYALTFVERPFSAIFIAAAGVLVCLPVYAALRSRRRAAAEGSSRG